MDIQKTLNQSVEQGAVHGVIAAATDKGTIFEGAAGDLRTGSVIWIASMTKALTGAAAMQLVERGKLPLDAPAADVLPEIAKKEVLLGIDADGTVRTRPPARPITLRHLLTHTSGLSYGFMEATVVDTLYRQNKIEFNTPMDSNLLDMTNKLATMPLLAQPGAAWNYSNATDVLGCLVQEISGVPFDQFLRERVIKPLGMVDTDFMVPADKVARFASNYYRNPQDGKLALLDDAAASHYLKLPNVISGGGGLVGTIGDYMKFCQFMLNKGTLNGTRLLGRKTVELMTANHLNGDMAAMGMPRFSESSYEGVGFGLGFSVTLDPARAQLIGSAGEYAWGGAASTAFWCDPKEDMAVVMFTQLMPSSTYPIRRELRVLTYGAVID